MHFKSLTLLAFLAAKATASPTVPTLDIPESQIAEMIWDVQVFPGGPTLSLAGTVEEVHAQLLEMNPNYDNESWDIEPTPETTTPTSSSLTPLTKRGDQHYCMPMTTLRNMAWAQWVNDGIEYLRRIKGKPRLQAGACSRVSCSWGSGIWWCNDDSQERELPSFDNIADGAQAIVNECADKEHPAMPFGGSLDHADLWRVIVKKGEC